jgi:hypothetical protein
MLSYEDIILLGEERVLVIHEHKDGRWSCGRLQDTSGSGSLPGPNPRSECWLRTKPSGMA